MKALVEHEVGHSNVALRKVRHPDVIVEAPEDEAW